MKTLRIRNVPNDVVDRLRAIAKRDGISVNTLAVRELEMASRRATNAVLFGRLPHREISVDEIVSAIDDGRDAERS